MININNHLNNFLDSLPLKKDEIKILKDWEKDKKGIDKPSWNDIFLTQAYNVAQRSVDSRTKHGCLIVNSSNEIVAEGYNGFVRNIDDRILPNYGSTKYDFMIHAEENAILNCARQGKSTLGCTIYLTGPPCIKCYQKLWQAGIKKIICGHKKSKMQGNEKEEKIMKILNFLFGGKLPIIYATIDHNYLQYLIKDIETNENYEN
jgi:dCMP deaminase